MIALRTPVWEDMEFVRRLWNDPATMAPGAPFVMSDEQAREWFARVVEPGSPSDRFCVILGSAGISVGEISYHRLDPRTQTADFNIRVAADERRKGYAHAAMHRFLQDFFLYRGGQMLVDDVALDNPVGQAALLRFGFVPDPMVSGVMRLVMDRAHFLARYRA